ncbi:hypothetical protein GMI70_02880 [Eggerthellaceae bacterium zg-893]|nr:hypothetical protein [Eggerthellaceae bacterium zg-893]
MAATAQVDRSTIDQWTRATNAASEAARRRAGEALRTLAAGFAGEDGAIAPGRVSAFRECAEEVMEAACRAAADASAVAAADAYEAIRAAATGRAGGALADPRRDPAATRGAVRGLVGQVEKPGGVGRFLRRMDERIDYEAKRASGECVLLNGRRERSAVRFARVPSGIETCAFCLMLASRGPVYLSEGTAGLGHYHAGCDCRIVPWFPGQEVAGYDPDALYGKWKLAEKKKGRES